MTTRKTTRKAARTRKPVKTKINWDEAERFFVQDESLPSVCDVARKFGVSFVTAYKWANERDWINKRAEYWGDVNAEVSSMIRSDTVNRLYKRWDKISKMVDDLINDLSSDAGRSEMTVSDLMRLIALEKQMVDEMPRPEGQEDDQSFSKILDVQVARIRSIQGGRSDNFNEVVNAGLRRLGIVDADRETTPASGHGVDEA